MRRASSRQLEGRLTGDEAREAEGKADQAKGSLKEAAGKLQDAGETRATPSPATMTTLRR